MAKATKQEKKHVKKQDTAEEFAAKVNKSPGKRNGPRIAFGWKR